MPAKELSLIKHTLCWHSIIIVVPNPCVNRRFGTSWYGMRLDNLRRFTRAALAGDDLDTQQIINCTRCCYTQFDNDRYPYTVATSSRSWRWLRPNNSSKEPRTA